MFKQTILCLLLIVSSHYLYAAERVDPLKAFLKNFQTLKANFTQVIFGKSGEQLEKATGTLYLQQPGKFHWAYETPYLQRIISDGKLLWIYDEDLEQVMIRELGNSIKQTPAGIILDDSKLEKYFIQTDLGNIDGYDWIDLRPHDPETQYKNIRIGFKQNRLGIMIINDHLDQTTRINFNNVNKNSKLAANLFSFEMIEDIDVIDQRDIEDSK